MRPSRRNRAVSLETPTRKDMAMSVEKAGMPIAERRFEAEETIYIHGTRIGTSTLSPKV
jgi:hypothetical protein